MTKGILLLAAGAMIAGSVIASASAEQMQYDPRTRRPVYNNGGPNAVYQQGRTRIYVSKRSWLDGGTEVLPGERKFMDYAQAPTYGWLAPTSSWDPLGTHRFPLPMPFELPGYSPYSYY